MADLASACDLERFYADHHAWLERWLRRRLRDAHDAADLAQDTYVRLLDAGRLPRPEHSRAFLVQVAKGLAIDLHRRRALEHAYLESLAAAPPAAAPSPEHRALVIETLMEIDRVLDALPARVRETFLLSRFDGLTYGAIAARLGVSVGAVRKYMLKAAIACLGALDAPVAAATPA